VRARNLALMMARAKVGDVPAVLSLNLGQRELHQGGVTMELSLFEVEFTGTRQTDDGKSTAFCLSVANRSTETEFTVDKRFSDFLRLKELLEDALKRGGFGTQLKRAKDLQFPSKKMLGKSKQKVVELRNAALSAWLAVWLADESLRGCLKQVITLQPDVMAEDPIAMWFQDTAILQRGSFARLPSVAKREVDDEAEREERKAAADAREAALEAAEAADAAKKEAKRKAKKEQKGGAGESAPEVWMRKAVAAEGLQTALEKNEALVKALEEMESWREEAAGEAAKGRKAAAKSKKLLAAQASQLEDVSAAAAQQGSQVAQLEQQLKWAREVQASGLLADDSASEQLEDAQIELAIKERSVERLQGELKQQEQSLGDSLAAAQQHTAVVTQGLADAEQVFTVLEDPCCEFRKQTPDVHPSSEPLQQAKRARAENQELQQVVSSLQQKAASLAQVRPLLCDCSCCPVLRLRGCSSPTAVSFCVLTTGTRCCYPCRRRCC